MPQTVKLGVGNWREPGRPKERLVVTLELRVGDLAGDLAERGFQTVEHEPVEPGTLTLSVTHDIVRMDRRLSDAFVAGGAGVPDDVRPTEWDAGWGPRKLERLRQIARRWHLNTMRAGCAHMELPEDTSYDARKEIECQAGTGYKYGRAWLVEPLPKDLLDELAAEYGLSAVVV